MRYRLANCRDRIRAFRLGRLAVTFVTMLLPAACPAQSLEALTRPQAGRSMRSTSTQIDGQGDYAHGNRDNSRVPPGATKVVLDALGPGVVTHMWFTFLGPEPHPWAKEGSANHQEVVLRIFYDGRERPGVEVPLGDFFANCFGQRTEVISLPVIVEDADSYNSFWHIPFQNSIRIELENQSEKSLNLLYYNIDWIKRDSLPNNTPYFYAQYRQQYPVTTGQDYVVVETEGQGHYVGTVLAVRTRSPSWFGEGDEKICVDGEDEPSIWGTGTEDYFLSAWGLKKCSTPYFGTSFFDQWGIVGGHTSAYRWHIHDPIVFQCSLKVAFEHWGWISPDENPEAQSHSWNERQDDYASVAYWYQIGEPKPGPPLPHARQRVLPNLDQVYPATPFADSKHHGSGQCRVQNNLGFHPEGQLFYRPPDDQEAWLQIPLQIDEKKPLRLLLRVTRANDYGIYQASLNGVRIGEPMDLYAEQVSPWEWHLLDFWPDKGQYMLRLECVGKNIRSTGHYLGIESVRLRERRPRVEQYAHDRDKDWTKEPVLYR